MVKCLLCKIKDLSYILSTQTKVSHRECTYITPVLVKEEAGGSLGLVSQASLGKSRRPGLVKDSVLKIKVGRS